MKVKLVLSVASFAASAALCGDVVEDALSRRLSAYDHFGMGEHMQELLVNRVAEMDHAADEAWFALKTPDEIAAYRARLRDRMIAAVGGFPERTPLNPQYFDVYKRDGYTIAGVVFESRPKHYVTGQFFIPADPAFKPPYPGVLITCGHTKAGKDSPCYQRAAVVAAKHGFATLIYDPIDQGERQQLPGTDIWSVGGHVNAGLRAHLVGWGTAQFRLWDGIRALDLLASRPEVNPKKVAVTGMSGGGTMSSYLNAVDWRFSAAHPAGFLTSMMYLGDKCGPQDCEQVIHGQLAFGLNHLSLMLMNGDSALCPGFTWGDFFPYPGSMETIRKAQEFRRREGRPELIDYFDCPGPHHWYESEKEAFCAWFRRHLVGDMSAWPVDRAALRRLDVGFDYANVDCALASKPECEVLSGRGVMSLPGARSVYDLIADELTRLEKSRITPTPDVVANAAGIKLADASAAKACASSSVEKDGVKVFTAVLDMPDMARVPVTAFIPAKAGGTPILVAGDATNRLAYAGKVRGLLAAGRPVAVAELRGFGETGATDRRSYWARRSPDQEIAAKLSWLGENLVAHRAEDLIAAAGWFAGLVGGAKCELRVEGRAVVPAAHAYFLARGRFVSFASERAPQSWTAMVRDPSIDISFAEVVYGALKSYDWTDLVK
ncbi:MAG: acetylxylan esterase [Kiritimatiellae bacterium]|nr:acetylxylan esterase [Kiritimatiellia bacterium]